MNNKKIITHAMSIFIAILLLFTLSGCDAGNPNPSGSVLPSAISPPLAEPPETTAPAVETDPEDTPPSATAGSVTAPADTPPNSAPPTIPKEPAPTQHSGKTQTFEYSELSLKVTNVASVVTKTGIDDGGYPREYTGYVLLPGAEIIVINADMTDGSLTENGQPHANWSVYLESSERVSITNDMPPLEITSDMVGVFSNESSVYVLTFEMYSES